MTSTGAVMTDTSIRRLPTPNSQSLRQWPALSRGPGGDGRRLGARRRGTRRHAEPMRARRLGHGRGRRQPGRLRWRQRCRDRARRRGVHHQQRRLLLVRARRLGDPDQPRDRRQRAAGLRGRLDQPGRPRHRRRRGARIASATAIGSPGPNDIVFDAQGGFWFTDLGKSHERTIDKGGVYYAQPDGSKVERKIWPMWTPNGVGLSPDESTLYVAESMTGRLWAFDLHEPGRHRAGRARVTADAAWPTRWGTSIRSPSKPTATSSSPRSATASAWSPLTDPTCTTSRCPTPMTTNVCFGGPDRRTAFVTLVGRAANCSKSSGRVPASPSTTELQRCR